MKPGRAPRRDFRGPPARQANVTLARALSKLGFCSRSQAQAVVQAGRVLVNGRPAGDAGLWVDMNRDKIEVDQKVVRAEEKLYLMLNKPRGLVTTTSDEHGRETVYSCFKEKGFAWLAPVGRLDKASEGLLLFSNDTQWAARVTDPKTGPDKTYHVQVEALADETLLEKLHRGCVTPGGDTLGVKAARVLRSGTRNSWLEIVLDEGKNRHIRRLLEVFGVEVARLVRVAIGPLRLGDLAKGDWRPLSAAEVEQLAK